MPTYAVTFTVTDAEGKTVTDAVVTIEGQTGTHTEGRWVFALPDGAGTQAAPYQIESGEQLAWLADIVSAGSGDAGGIVGRYNNSKPRITGCYNTLTDCYYLTGSIPAGALDNGANAMTLTEMQTTLLAALGEENWKQVRGVNQGLPILGWQKATSPAVFAQLAKYTRFSRESYITDDGEESSLPTSLLMWVPEENAQSYTVTLWQAVKTWIPLNEEEKAAYDAAQTAEEKLWLIDDNHIIGHRVPCGPAHGGQFPGHTAEGPGADIPEYLHNGGAHHHRAQGRRRACAGGYTPHVHL